MGLKEGKSQKQQQRGKEEILNIKTKWGI